MAMAQREVVIMSDLCSERMLEESDRESNNQLI